MTTLKVNAPIEVRGIHQLIGSGVSRAYVQDTYCEPKGALELYINRLIVLGLLVEHRGMIYVSHKRLTHVDS